MRDPGNHADAPPDRFCGIHFFHPVPYRPLVEIIRGPRTSPQTMTKAAAYARQIGKLPIMVSDGPGFFQYPQGHGDGPASPDPQLARIIDTWSRRPTAPRGGNMTFRLLLPMLLEASRLLEESKVSNLRSIDLGVVFGLGFPSFGLLGWADALALKPAFALVLA